MSPMTPTRRSLSTRSAAALVATIVAYAMLSLAGASAHASSDDGLTLIGDPLRHTFDTSVAGDAVEGSWTITNRSTGHVLLDAALAPVGVVSGPLVDALTVEYAEVATDGDVLWHEAGTVGDPQSLRSVIGSGADLAAGTSLEIPVRVSLPDPSRLTGQVGEMLSVEAAFTVTYVVADDVGSGPGSDEGTTPEIDGQGTGPGLTPGEDASPSEPGPGTSTDPSIADRLATTGLAGQVGIIALAVVLVWVGARITRKVRDSRW